MLILAYCEINEGTIEGSLGDPDYSYFFVFRQFVKALEKTFSVIPVTGNVKELDLYYENCMTRGETCFCLFFSQPHKIPSTVSCPIIPVFAWEFDSLPRNMNNGIDSDWGWRLAKHGWAITHSNYSVDCVKKRIRNDFPVIAIPSPVWDEYRHYFDKTRRPLDQPFSLEFKGTLIDSAALGVDRLNPKPWKKALDEWMVSIIHRENNSVSIKGVIYLSIFNPSDGRKNWLDMLTAFCWEFRKTPDATLVLKLGHKDADTKFPFFLRELYKLSPFSCRVIIIHGYLADEFYSQLINQSDYAVNASHGEGQCLPLMEGMSAGKPAISPDHTAMRDYLRPENAFIVESSPEPTFWPLDPGHRLRALHYRINWKSLCTMFRESYTVIKQRPRVYEKMSLSAYQTMSSHCSRRETIRKFKGFITSRRRVYKLFDRNWRSRTFPASARLLMALRLVKRRLMKPKP